MSTYLTETTDSLVEPARSRLRVVTEKHILSIPKHVQHVLAVVYRELGPGLRYSTVVELRAIVADEASAAMVRGNEDFSADLEKVVRALSDVLSDLDNVEG